MVLGKNGSERSGIRLKGMGNIGTGENVINCKIGKNGRVHVVKLINGC